MNLGLKSFVTFNKLENLTLLKCYVTLHWKEDLNGNVMSYDDESKVASTLLLFLKISYSIAIC